MGKMLSDEELSRILRQQCLLVSSCYFMRLGKV